MNLNLTLPRWESLSRDDVIFIARLFLEGNTKEEFLVKAFLYLAKLKVLRTKKKKKYDIVHNRTVFEMSAEEIHDFSRECAFLFKPGFFPVFPIVNNITPRDTTMSDATFAEFVNALNAFAGFNSIIRDRSNLIELCLVMHPGAKRKSIERLEGPIIYTSYMWFSAVLDMVMHICPALFSAEEPESPEPDPGQLIESIEAMYDIATDNVLPHRPVIANMNMWEALRAINKKIIQIQERHERL